MIDMTRVTTARKIPSRSLEVARQKNEGSSSVRLAGLRTAGISLRKNETSYVVMYVHDKGVDDFVQQVHGATPIQLVEAERKGVDGRFLKDLSRRIDIPAARVFTMLGVPKATAEKKALHGAIVSGSGGQAAIAIAKLLGAAKSIVENSTSPEAKDFDSAKWLGKWLERPQPALGGRKPADLIDTPTGVEVVTRLLGAIESGAYQ
jgi:putative toxin-antitoxin system antitoxin component (TIGR02293 family)